MATFPADYYASSEGQVNTLEEFATAVRHISAFQLRTGSRFVWRGASDADWRLYSSLVRVLRDKLGRMPSEDEVQTAELDLLREARDWSLDWHPAGGRLSALELLAALQHYETPTRLMDFTFNPVVALWFAVEKHDGVDGRLFAIDMADRLASRTDAAARDPWWTLNPPPTWSAYAWVWRPPPFEPRIVRQDGCFLVGGIPGTVPARNVKPGGRDKWRPMLNDEVQACMSVPVSLIQFRHAKAAYEGKRLPGKEPTSSAFTIRVRNKASIRDELEQGWGYTHASIYPDFPGFTRYAKSVQR